MSAEVMTSKDRDLLAKVARQRARVAKSTVALRQAQLLADFEEQSSAIYSAQDEAWAEVTAQAQEMVRQADEQVAAACRERNIPEEFRPSLNLSWYGRGGNSKAARRAELRKLAERQIEAAAKAAKLEIDRADAEVQVELLTGALTTEAARRFLERIPSPEELMPAVRLEQLEQQVPRRQQRELPW